MKIEDLQTQLNDTRALLATAAAGGNRTAVLGAIQQANQALAGLQARLEAEGVEIKNGSDGSRAGAMPGGVAGAGPGAPTVIPDFDSRMVEAFETGFGAVVYLWDASTQKHYERPDAKVRLDTAKAYLAYRLGMPPQMLLRLDSGFRDQHTELVEMAKSPMGQQMLLRAGIIDEAWIVKHLKSVSQK